MRPVETFHSTYPTFCDPAHRSECSKVMEVALKIFCVLTVLPFLLWGAYYLLRKWAFCCVVMKASHFSAKDREIMGNQRLKQLDGTPIALHSPDGTRLDAAYFPPLDPKNQWGWIFLPGIGSQWQTSGTLSMLAGKAHILALNAEAFGESEHSNVSEHRFGLNVSGAGEFLIKEKNIPPNNLMVIGRSMGGGIGAIGASYLQEEYPDASIKLVSWSSYKNFSTAARYAIGGCSGFCASLFVHMLGYNIDALSAAKKIKHKLVVWHPHDPVIPDSAQLAGALEKDNESFIPMVLGGKSHNSHTRLLSSEEQKEFFAKIQQLYDRSTSSGSSLSGNVA